MWMTVRDYSREKDIAPNNVYKKAKEGKIASKKVKGVLMVKQFDESEQPDVISKEDADTAYNEAIRKRADIENDLKEEKLKNLKLDAELKRQKSISTREEYRREFVEGVYEVFTDSFADVKGLLIEMRLTKEQIHAFQEAFKQSLQKFGRGLKKYLSKGGDADEKEID